jgi:rhamnosyltransferase
MTGPDDMAKHGVSIVIPTRNGAATLPALLDAVWHQRVSWPIETIAIDSGSTDGTLELLKGKVDHLINITPQMFDHGLTRNLGIMQARGDFVVMLVQDAVPADETWLETLTAPLASDERVAGTFARQTARPGASGTARRSLEKWVASGNRALTKSIESQRELDDLPPMQRLFRCAFDNVCSCIRRSVWAEHPFHAATIAEDLQWAHEVMLAGYSIVFVPDAVVVHSHDRSPMYEFKRTRALHSRLFQLFELETIPSVPLLLRSIATTFLAHLWYERGSPARVPRAAALAVAWPLGQYLGARDERARSDNLRHGILG